MVCGKRRPSVMADKFIKHQSGSIATQRPPRLRALPGLLCLGVVLTALPAIAQTPPLETSEVSGDRPRQICVERFTFEGNTVISDRQLNRAIWKTLAISPAPQGCATLSFEQIVRARGAVTQEYIDRGYLTSGAYIPAQQEVAVDGGVVEMQVLEGSLQDIRVEGNQHLSDRYIVSRLNVAEEGPLRQDELVESLQLLRLDPNIDSVQAEVMAGSQPGTNILDVRVNEANPFQFGVTLDNNRSPSAGSFRRNATASYSNLFGIGDRLSASYTNTNGSNELDASFRMPVNPDDGTVSLQYRSARSEVVEDPFTPLDILATYRSFEVGFRQPFRRFVTRNDQAVMQEFALGLSFDRQESETSILGMDFPLSPGADEDGNTDISALRFSQEWTQRSWREVLAARSEFSLGVGWFDATVNDEAPDSRFFAWRGQFQFLRRLGQIQGDLRAAPSVLLRSDVQLASRALLPLEQFSVGGQHTVRGYRQNALLTDNGVLASAELWLPVWRWEQQQGVLSVVPFVDVGTGWNGSGNDDPDPGTLVGAGLGLLWQQGDTFRARLDWGIPLVDIDTGDEDTWQENGVYFTVEFDPF